MNIEFSPELEAFRKRVADFLDVAPTPDIREAGRKTTSVFAPFDEAMEWHRILHAKGWAAPAWPVEYGGTGWSIAIPSMNKIVTSELAQRVSTMMTRVSGLEAVVLQVEALTVGSSCPPIGSELELIAMPY